MRIKYSKPKFIAFALISFIILTLNSCITGKKASDTMASIYHYSDTVTYRNGTLIYALPRTVLTIEVTTERSVEVPGPYSAYAADLLGLDKVITSKKESWLIKNITVNSHEEVDPAQYYVIRSGSLFRSNVLALKNEGLILDLNPVLYNSIVPVISENGSVPAEFKAADLGSDEYYIAQNDTAYRRVALDSTFIRIPYVVEKKKRLSEAQLAERAARRLMELREGKILILTGETNIYPQSDAAINELNKLIKDYTELFTGKKINENRKYTFQVIPAKDKSGSNPGLFNFSDQAGISDINVKNSQPVTISFTPEQKTLGQFNESKDNSASDQAGRLIYRVPDVVGIKISLGSKLLYSGRLLISQFGELMELPGNYIIGK